MSEDSRALMEAGKLLADIAGTCPSDMFGWDDPETCRRHCNNDPTTTSGCWVQYLRHMSANNSETPKSSQ